MAKVKVLIGGIQKKNEDGSMRIGSTVTLIKSDKNIIVDTGSFLEGKEVLRALKEEGLAPEDIGIVVLTHLHLDHTVNTYLFEKAKIYCKFRSDPYPGQAHSPENGCLKRIELTEGTEIAENVSIMSTPGHTNDMISILIETEDGKKIVIAGDAIPNESFIDESKQPELSDNLEQFNQSRKKILKMADYIVPGHGNIFEVKK